MTAIVSRHLLAPTNQNSQVTLHTTGANSTLTLNTVMQNLGSAPVDVSFAIANASQTGSIAVVGPADVITPVRNNTPPSKLVAARANSNALLISDDHTSASYDGGATWITPATDVWYGITITPDEVGRPFKLVCSGSTVSVFPYSQLSFNPANLHSNAYSTGSSSVADGIRANPALACNSVVLNSAGTEMVAFFPSTGGGSTRTRYYHNTSAWTTDTARSLTLVTTLEASGLGVAAIPIANTTSGYFGWLNLNTSSLSYNRFDSLADTTATNATVTNPIATEGTTAVRVAHGAGRALVITSNSKAVVVDTAISGAGNPSYLTALSALPGSIAVGSITGVWAVGSTRWALRTANKLYITSDQTTLSWTEVTGIYYTTSPLAAPTPNTVETMSMGYGTVHTHDVGMAGWFGTVLSTEGGFDAASIGYSPGLYIGSTWYPAAKVQTGITFLDRYTVAPAETVEVTGRIFGSSTAIHLITDDPSNVGLNVVTYGVES